MKGIYYELRNYFTNMTDMIEKASGIKFGTFMFDTMRTLLPGHRDKDVQLPSGKLISRSFLEACAQVDLLSVKRLPMPILKADGAEHAHLISDERGIRMRLCWGRKNVDFADVVLQGTAVGSTGKSYKVNPKEKDRDKYRKLLKLISGEWKWQTPIINFDEKGRFKLQIPYTRPKAESMPLSGKPAQLTFATVKGNELRESKNESIFDPEKIYVLHLTHGKRKYRIPANDVIADIKEYEARRSKAQFHLSCRRFWPRHSKEKLERQRELATKARNERAKLANHVWSRRIVQKLLSWQCRRLTIYGPPNGAVNGLTGTAEVPWQWSEFMNKLLYKADEYRIQLTQVPFEDAAKLTEEIEREDDGEEAEAGKEAAAGAAG
jgi:hypothetical protein